MKRFFCWITFSVLLTHVYSQNSLLKLRSGDFNVTAVNDYFEADTEELEVFHRGVYGSFGIGTAEPNQAVGLSSKLAIESYVGHSQYYVWISNECNPKDATEMGFNALYALQPEWKIDPQLVDLTENADSTIEVNCFTFLELGNKQMREDLASRSYTISSFDALTNSLVLQLTTREIARLASLPWFYWFEKTAPPLELNNLVERTNHRVPVLEGTNSLYNLSGKDVVVGEWDGSGAQLHIDYDYRHIQAEPFTSNGNGRHATHVAGTVLGAGIIDPNAKGMAPEAELISYDFRGNIPLEMDSAVIKYDMVLTQNSYSYGSNSDPCSRRGTYDGVSVALDQLTNKYDYLLHVFAAGNSRSSNCISGGYGTVHSGFQASKNSISVGALSRTDGNSSFHSYGPVRDGRLKPEICGVGVNVYSTFPFNAYRGGYNGTSMACPGVSGVAALIHQLYQDSNSAPIPAHLLKGSLCNGADEIGRAGPDYQFGFGRVNAQRTAEVIAGNTFVLDSVNQNGVFTDTIYVADGLMDFKVLLCWNDPAASPSATAMLVNDLDLEIVDSVGNIILPWVLDATQYTATATRGRDSLNPIEQITLVPNSPYYIVKVTGRRVTNGYQQFSVNWLAQDTSIKVIYPNGGEQWESPSTGATAQIIRWDDYGLSGTTRVEFSQDSGSTWTTLASAVAADRKYYNWGNANAALTTAGARIRVTKQNVVDASDANFHIGQKGPVPSGTVCSAQVHLRWSAVPNAKQYTIYRLDSGQMRLYDTSDVPYYTMRGLQNDTAYWVAIGVVNADGSEGPRSNGVRFTPANTLTPVSFTQQPQNMQLCAGSELRLMSAVTGSLPLQVQWQESTDGGISWQDLSEVSTSYVNPSIGIASNNTRYRIKGVNQCLDTVYSLAALVQVDTALLYQMSLDSIALCLNQDSSVRLNYSASNPPNFTWYYKELVTDMPTELTATSPDYPLEKVTESNEGYYGVELTNTCGSTSAASYTFVEIRPPLAITNSASDTVCVGALAELTANATGGDADSYDFWWYSDTDTVTTKDNFYSPETDRTWTINVFDNCSEDTVTKSIRVVLRDSLMLHLPSDSTLCYGQGYTLNASASGGNERQYEYLWDDIPQNTPSRITDSFTTRTYRLRLTDGCSADTLSKQATITVRNKLNLVLETDLDTACHLQEVTLTAKPTGGLSSGYAIRWDDGNTNTTRKLNLAQNTSFSAVLQDGCSPQSAEDSLFLPVRLPLDITIAGPDTVCFGETVLFTALPLGGDPSQYQYSWNGVVGDATAPRSFSSSENLILRLEDNCTPQSAENTKFIVARLPLSASPLASEVTICKGQDITIGFTPQGGRSPSYAIDWGSVSETTNQINVAPTDTATYTYTLRDGCTVPEHSSTITVNVRPALTLDLGDDLQKCAEDEITLPLNGAGGLTAQHRYLMNNEVFMGANLVFDQAVTETVYLELLDDCTVTSAKDTITVSVVPLEDTAFSLIPIDHKSVELRTTVSPNRVRIDWGDGSSTSQNTESIVHAYRDYGVYTVCKTELDSIGCERSSCKTYNLYNPFTLESFEVKLYPNPVGNTKLVVETDRIFGNYTVRLVDSRGRTVYEQEGENTTATQFSIDMNGVASGVYVLEALLNDKPYRFKVIRE